MNVILKINNIFKYVEKTIMILAVLMMAIVLFANVVGRLVFHHSLTYAEELATLGTIYVTFAGLSYCARTNQHINMTAIFDALKGKPRKILMCIIAIVVAVALFALGYIAFGYIQNLHMLGKVTPALSMPIWLLYMVIPVFIWITAIQYVLIFFMNIFDKSGEAILGIEEIGATYDQGDFDDEDDNKKLMDNVEIEGGTEDE